MPFDLSQVLFIATANLMDPVPAALRDRMEVIELPGYTEEEKLEIARRFLLPRQLEQNGIGGVDFEISRRRPARAHASSYTREAGVRNLEREIGALCRKVARRVAEDEQLGAGARRTGAISRTCSGRCASSPSWPSVRCRPGVAVGLAWTPAGGDILFIESTAHARQEAACKLTGSLGDVMRESVEAARSWLRATRRRYGIDAALFEAERHPRARSRRAPCPRTAPRRGRHGHLAGVAVHAAARRRPDVAMTGEITLRGKVLPVGGIKEKVLAAKRAGIRRVVLPERNRQDVEEIQARLLEGWIFEYVGTIDEALQHTLSAPARAA